MQDRGPGVTDAEREAIFSRFRRGTAADSPGAPRGTGLGLALSAQHITLHGGRMWVEDRDGGAPTTGRSAYFPTCMATRAVKP